MADEEGRSEASRKMDQAPEHTLEELLRSLNLKGEDIDGFVVARSEVETLKEGTKWLAVARLLTSKPFSVSL
jgi:hypothetical protein